MAKLHLPLITLGLLATLAGATGCQQPMSTSSAYVEPTFGAPSLAAVRQPPVAVPLPPPPPPAMAVVPRPRAARPTSPALAAVPKAWVPPVAARPWRWIVVHHSDTETGNLAYIDKLHKARGWDGVGYDFVIGNGTGSADGQVEVGYRWSQQAIGAHTKTLDNRFNEYGIGICLVGDMMNHPPTAKQMASIEHLTAYLMATYHIAPDHILGHRDAKPTDCPGRYTNLTLIRSIAARQAGGLGAIAGVPYRRPAGEMLVQATALR